MKDLLYTFEKDLDYHKYFKQENICFLDIETTGFSRNKNIIYLIGIQYYNQSINNWSIRQLFAESINEEKEILLKFIELLSDFDKIITFNGDAFDLPFINSRLEILDIPYVLDKARSFDLYKIIKNNNAFLGLNSLKLESLEEYLGLYRKDLYSGKDCIGFYFDYINSLNKESLEKIIQHNYDDLYYMIDILKILDIIKDKKSFYIPHNGENLNIFIESIKILDDKLIACGIFPNPLDNEIIHYDMNFFFSLDINKRFKLSIDCSLGLISPTEKGYYIDKKNLVLAMDIIDNTRHNLPSRFLLLKVENDYCIENIKNLIKVISKEILRQYLV